MMLGRLEASRVIEINWNSPPKTKILNPQIGGSTWMFLLFHFGWYFQVPFAVSLRVGNWNLNHAPSLCTVPV